MADDPFADIPVTRKPAEIRNTPPVNRMEGDDPFADIPVRQPNAARDFLQSAGDVMAGAGRAVASAVTGNDRREYDFPEVEDRIIPGFGSLKSKMALAQTPEGQVDIFKSQFPDAPVTQDKFGNYMTLVDGKPAYLNRPGISGQDVENFATTGAIAAAPGGVGVRAGRAVLGGLGAVAGAGVGAGVASVGQDILAGQAGSQQGVSGESAAINAVGGAGFQALSPIANAIYRGIAGKVTDAAQASRLYTSITGNRSLFDDASQRLTPDGEKLMADLGIDISTVTPDFSAEFGRQARQAASPADAARSAQAQSLPVPVPLTRGDISRIPDQQMFESQAEKGVYGDVASTVMRQARQDQQAALRGNVEAIQQRLSGGEPAVTQPQQAGQIVQEGLQASAARRKAVVDRLYDRARETEGGVPLNEAQKLRYIIGNNQAVSDRLSNAPKAMQRLEALDKLTAGGDGSVLVSSLQDWRRATTTLAREAQDPTEKAALSAMVREFDAALPDMVKAELIQGDPTSVAKWSKAIRARRDWAKKFEGDDLVQQLTAKEYRGGSIQPTVAPEDATKLIFGISDAGLAPKMNMARDLRRVRGILGETSPAWQAMREEAFLRLARAGEGSYVASTQTREFSGAKFAKAVDDALSRNPEVMRTLFTPDERALLNQFKEVAVRVTTTARGGQNFSNTSAGNAQAIRNTLLPFLNGLGAKAKIVFSSIAPTITDAVYGPQAAAAARGGVARATLPPAVLPATGAATGQQYQSGQ